MCDPDATVTVQKSARECGVSRLHGPQQFKELKTAIKFSDRSGKAVTERVTEP